MYILLPSRSPETISERISVIHKGIYNFPSGKFFLSPAGLAQQSGASRSFFMVIASEREQQQGLIPVAGYDISIPVGVSVDLEEVPFQKVGLAYDVSHDIRRYRELKEDYGEREARRLLTEEMSVDLLTHFGELGGETGRIGYFSYRYLFNEDGELVEDTEAQKPIREMFEEQKSVVADLWNDWMIPFFEESAVGGSAFTLSAKRDGDYEGKYDYVYFFQKESETEILCFGLELDLSKREQAAVLNRQYRKNGQLWMLLDDDPSSEEIKGRALFYPPGYFKSHTHAYVDIVGEAIGKQRSEEYRLSSSDEFLLYVRGEEDKLHRKKSWIEELARGTAHRISEGTNAGELQSSISEVQRQEIMAYEPTLLIDAQQHGRSEIVLPCGIVEINTNSGGLSSQMDLKETVGDGLIEGSTSVMKCVECPFCKKTVDAIVTSKKIKCPECKSEADK